MLSTSKLKREKRVKWKTKRRKEKKAYANDSVPVLMCF